MLEYEKTGFGGLNLVYSSKDTVHSQNCMVDVVAVRLAGR